MWDYLISSIMRLPPSLLALIPIKEVAPVGTAGRMSREGRERDIPAPPYNY
jgi:hypothetical protein